ncbi:Crinkler effector protein 8, partial [Cucurbita argyrosperma subsp. sororia]
MPENTETSHQHDYDSSSPKHPLDDSIETRPPNGGGGGGGGHLHRRHFHHHDSSTPFISTPLYLPTGTGNTPPFEAVNPKRTRYSAGQWKLVPSPSSSQPQIAVVGSDSSPSPSQRPAGTAAASSSDTTSSPSHSPLPLTTGNKGEGESQNQPQYRKGKYVSPVWKPNEMLWLARAWRVQYQGGSDEGGIMGGQGGRGSGKTRADKDREVAEYLQKHGVNRDAKTAGTKWDNMLGEFRKVYEWERGGEREQLMGKSYFRLSPYERKLHRLPASFDEQVFEELSQFMGSKMRTKPTPILPLTRPLPPPPPFTEEHLPILSREKQVFRVDYASVDCSSVRRIGKVRMVWEESVSLWGEEGSEEQRGGRIRVEGCSFLNAEELTFFDESMVACTMECNDDGPLKGLSVDRFVPGQQIKVFGRRKSPFSTSTVPHERLPILHSTELSSRSSSLWNYQDSTEYYVGCLRIPPLSLPSLSELSWHIQEPPSEELRFPIRKDVYAYLPQGKEVFFTTTTEMVDCKSFIYEILCPIIRTNPCISTTTPPSSRDSFIGLWDDCINRLVSEFCCMELQIIRKPNSPSSTNIDSLQDQWPNLTGFIRNFCLWRGEETDQIKDGHQDLDPSNSIVEKLLWTYLDIPYLLGYYTIGFLVTFCSLSRGRDNRVVRTDLYSLDLSTPSERLKALVPCYRIGGVLSLLADQCNKLPIYSDFERIDMGNGIVVEMTPNLVTKIFSCRRKWTAAKEIYDVLDQRIPHSEFIFGASEEDLALVFKPRVCRLKPTSYDQLIEALKNVTKALVALHDLCFMHRDICWEKVMKRTNADETATGEWILCGFEEAVGAPQIYPYGEATAASRRHAPEMERGLHGVKVDMWGVGFLIKTCGLIGIPKMLNELQHRCMDQNPEHRPTAADCYHHLLQLQSSLSTSTGAAGGGLI